MPKVSKVGKMRNNTPKVQLSEDEKHQYEKATIAVRKKFQRNLREIFR